jgi:hypothetical protein
VHAIIEWIRRRVLFIAVGDRMRNVCAMIFLPFAIEMDAMSLDPVVVSRQGVPFGENLWVGEKEISS